MAHYHATHYWLPTVEEAEELTTYIPDHHPMAFTLQGIIKIQVPEEYRVPTENSETIDKAKRWFETSNREDLYVLEKEKEAFEFFYLKEMKEIKRHLP